MKKIPHFPLLGLQIDFFLTVKQHPAVQQNPALIRFYNSGNRFQRHTLSAAGSPQDPCDPLRMLQIYRKPEIPQFLFYMYGKTHTAPAFLFRFSSILTASRITAEITRFTITHCSASPSSLVRHSW